MFLMGAVPSTWSGTPPLLYPAQLFPPLKPCSDHLSNEMLLSVEGVQRPFLGPQQLIDDWSLTHTHTHSSLDCNYFFSGHPF